MKSEALAAACAILLLGGCQQADMAEGGAGAGADASTAAEAPPGPPPSMGDPSKNPDMTGLAKEVDTNGDGKMSRAEWAAKGLPMSSFDMFEKGRGYVTLQDYQKNAAPAGIDLNGDGKLTVEEFIQFDKQYAPKAPGKDEPKPEPGPPIA